MKAMTQIIKSCRLSAGCRRLFHGSSKLSRRFNEPMSEAEAPRCAGIASMMRLPIQKTSQGEK